jgi:methylated-DNA-[protein]-cysteine S-methyltransferase
MKIETASLKSPFGDLALFAREGALCALGWTNQRARIVEELERRFGALEPIETPDPAGALRALTCYAEGDVTALDAIAVDTGGTEFQCRVWRALREIPAGTTISYAELARRVGDARAMRAVGAANGRNPVAIVIPCHRVIASDGSLHGYGGGLDRKRALLDHERRFTGAPLLV